MKTAVKEKEAQLCKEQISKLRQRIIEASETLSEAQFNDMYSEIKNALEEDYPSVLKAG